MPATAASRVPPGTVLVRDPDQFVVQCADHPIAMLGWQTAQTEV